MIPSSNNTLGVIRLTTLIINLVIGAVIFDLPRNMAESSWVISTIIVFVVTSFAMFLLALILQILTQKAPSIKGSIYKYSKVGFGNYVGFNIAFGYWISALIGNASFIIIGVSALGYFFPVVGGGPHTISGIIAESAVLWIVILVILKGIEGATILNAAISFMQLISLLLLFGIGVYFFQPSIFKHNLAPASWEHISLFSQVKGSLMIGVFSFIGIEGASLYANRAKNKLAPIIATFLGVSITLVLLISICVVGLSLSTRGELLSYTSMPSTALIAGKYIGRWGPIIINTSIIISVIGAVLSWTLLASEVLLFASQDKLFSALFSRVDHKHTPRNAVLLSAIAMQFMLIGASFAERSYYMLISLCAAVVLFPYLLTCMFFLKKIIYQRIKHKTALLSIVAKCSGDDVITAYQHATKDKQFTNVHVTIGVLGTSFFICFLIMQGLKLLMLSSIIYTIGFFVYLITCLANRRKIWNNNLDRALSAIILLAAIASLFLYII